MVKSEELIGITDFIKLQTRFRTIWCLYKGISVSLIVTQML